ncbi:MAG TPA: hypothetical protein VK205_08415 [Prolixibacteraceae bacterium]|nr:hypothetical protein [Prolixibacteraceae bacterium]
MNKRKLVNIILKDLEEVRILSEEVAESEEASLIEIELALNRAKLLIHEIELLRELAGGPTFVHDRVEEEYVEEQDQAEHDENITYPEPELEITNYNNEELPQDEELPVEEEDFGQDEEEDEDLDDDLEDDDFDQEEEAENEEEAELEIDEDELKEEDWDETEEEPMEDENEEPAPEEVKQQPASPVQAAELKSNTREGFREINMDDDDDDIQPIRVASPTAATGTARPPMREIPKPEDVIADSDEKAVMGEKFHKERTLNDTLGETKAPDSKLTNGPITSLKAAIGLNDRFLFTREIFNNNSAKYNEVIDNLDKMDQIQEAVEYLRANLTMQKNEASMKFVELLKRRFTK